MALRRPRNRLNKVFGSPDAKSDAVLKFLEQLVSCAETVGRQPVRTDFTEKNRRDLKAYYVKYTKRDLAFRALCDLLGEPLGENRLTAGPDHAGPFAGQADDDAGGR